MASLSTDPKAIFVAALERDAPEDRVRFLDQACGNDRALRSRVEELLQAHQAAGGFLAGEQDHSPTVCAAPVDQLGAVIGPYKLLEQIGEGGMGVVFMAQQQEPVRRRVALKIVKPGMDTRQVIARFEAERQALAMMDHPNIAKVHDAGATENGRPYFVMELVQGVPITEYCDQCNLETSERLELFISVCQAVQHAHQKGIIHRDIKPTNVLVAIQDGRPAPKIIDFGVAKAINQQLTEHTLMTAFAQIVGTPLYMSPEQAELSPLGVDTRSDIYSLGVLLYELLTGTTPFDRDRLHAAPYDEFRRIIREEEPPDLTPRISTLAADFANTVAENRRTDARRLRQTVRGELDWIVMKCLEKDRNRRYETASGLARDIERYLSDEPVQACPPSAVYRLRKFAWRNKVPFFAASVLTIAVLAALSVLSVSNARITRERNEKGVALTEKVAALEMARTSEREAKDQLFLSLLSQAKAHRRGGQMGQRVESLSALEQAAQIRVDERLRNEAIAAMALSDIRRGPAWKISIPENVVLACDRPYQRYVRLDGSRAFSVRRLADDREIQRLVPVSERAVGPLRSLVFSPDGKRVAASESAGAFHVWRLADAAPLLPDTLATTCPPVFTADSRYLAIGQNESTVCYDLTTGKESARWPVPGKPHAMAFNPDGRRLAVTYHGSGAVSIYDVADGGTQLGEIIVGPRANPVVTWHPDGSRLAVSDASNRIQIWDVAAKSNLATLAGHFQQLTGLAFHPNGALLISNSWDGVVRMWDAASGRQVMQVPCGLVQLEFSEDHRYLGVVLDDQQIQPLEVVPTRVYRTFVSSLGAGQGGYQEGDFSPDGRLLAIAMDDGTRLWDVIEGRELARLPEYTISVAFRHGGRELFTCGPTGVNRWPIDHPQDSPRELHVGPPHAIPVPVFPHRAVVTANGAAMAVVSESNGAAVIVRLSAATSADSKAAGKNSSFKHPQTNFVALSDDGRWLATSAWHSARVRLWDAHTGRMEKEWNPAGSPSHVFFTPDSRALVISRGHEFEFWDIANSKPKSSIRRDVALYPGHVAFSPDGRLMALEMAPGVIHLKDVATHRTVARLEDPNGDRASWIGFSPDGTQLAVVAHYARCVHTWDLRAIRTELKTMDLDWESPPFASADSNKGEEILSKPILRVKVHEVTSKPNDG